MCKVVAYLCTDVIRLSLKSLTSSQFYWYFYIDTESKSPYPLTSSTHLPTSSLFSLSGSIVTPTPTPIGK